ncbi:MAG: phosphatidylglycerophosphatase A [Holosporales bacterium]|jgi:phosphatidylglycerophosphatase A|nr:phosphatidylglycerophosphatase A [Holosporales bacterium]
MIKYRIATVISTFFFLGKLPVAPGTVGSLGGILLFVLIKETYAYLLLVFGLCVVGSWSVRLSLEKADSPDPKYIVIDEVIGQMVALAPMILFHNGSSTRMYFLSFILFRAFDIWKPWPINLVDELTYRKNISGTGQVACIIGDDMLAGLAAGAGLSIIVKYFNVS